MLKFVVYFEDNNTVVGFACKAENRDHAIEQAKNACPDLTRLVSVICWQTQDLKNRRAPIELKKEVEAIAQENGWSDSTVLEMLCHLLESLEGGAQGTLEYLRTRELIEHDMVEPLDLDVLRGAVQFSLSTFLSWMSERDQPYLLVLGDESAYDSGGSIYLPTSEEYEQIRNRLDVKAINMDQKRRIFI